MATEQIERPVQLSQPRKPGDFEAKLDGTLSLRGQGQPDSLNTLQEDTSLQPCPSYDQSQLHQASRQHYDT